MEFETALSHQAEVEPGSFTANGSATLVLDGTVLSRPTGGYDFRLPLTGTSRLTLQVTGMVRAKLAGPPSWPREAPGD